MSGHTVSAMSKAAAAWQAAWAKANSAVPRVVMEVDPAIYEFGVWAEDNAPNLLYLFKEAVYQLEQIRMACDDLDENQRPYFLEILDAP